MFKQPRSTASRRRVSEADSGIAVARRWRHAAVPCVHAAENNTIQLALIGCGGRGTGAADNASVHDERSHQTGGHGRHLRAEAGDQLTRICSHSSRRRSTYPKHRQFIGFDAYKKAIDCLNPGDVAIFASYPAFRWVFFQYAIEKGVNVFMEKPVTVDGPTTRKMLALAERVREEESQGGRRSDDPTLPRPAAVGRTDPRQ